jgi:hypothetical protein
MIYTSGVLQRDSSLLPLLFENREGQWVLISPGINQSILYATQLEMVPMLGSFPSRFRST